MFGKRVGFLKFKADVIDKETGKKVDQLMASLFGFFFDFPDISQGHVLVRSCSRM